MFQLPVNNDFGVNIIQSNSSRNNKACPLMRAILFTLLMTEDRCVIKRKLLGLLSKCCYGHSAKPFFAGGNVILNLRGKIPLHNQGFKREKNMTATTMNALYST